MASTAFSIESKIRFRPEAAQGRLWGVRTPTMRRVQLHDCFMFVFVMMIIILFDVMRGKGKEPKEAKEGRAESSRCVVCEKGCVRVKCGA